MQDARQGTIFYRLSQAAAIPRFERDDTCLACHLSWETPALPGLMVLSTFPMADDPNAYARGFVSDHRSPIGQRWGGWYVTGQAPSVHMGNVPTLLPAGTRVSRPTACSSARLGSGRFDLTGFSRRTATSPALPGPGTPVRAMMNFITRLGWEARLALPAAPNTSGARAGGRALVGGLPAFRARGSAAGCGSRIIDLLRRRSRRAVRGIKQDVRATADLQRRLLKHRCSYMIYSPAFDALPATAKSAVYERLWNVLVRTGRGGAVQHARATGAYSHRRDSRRHQAGPARLLQALSQWWWWCAAS